METFNKLSVYTIFALKIIFKDFFGEHVPYEIISEIIMTIFPEIKIYSGASHSILSIDNRIYVWGYNLRGILCMDYNKMCVKSPQEIPALVNISGIVRLGSNQVKLISCAKDHTMIVTKNDEIYIYGMISNDSYKDFQNKFHIQNIKSICSSESVTIILTESGEIYTWGSNSHGQLGIGRVWKNSSPQKIPLENIVSISCSKRHVMVVNKFGEVYAWGCDRDGKLGLGKTDDDYVEYNYEYDMHYINNFYNYLPQKINLENVKTVYCGNSHTIAMTKFGEVFTWGNNLYGQLGLGHFINHNTPQKVNLENIQSVVCGHEFSVALTKNGDVYAWGNNSYGQLGLGVNEITKTSLPQKVHLQNIITISCGELYVNAIDKFNKVYVWGRNDHYQLGLGHCINQYAPQLLCF